MGNPIDRFFMGPSLHRTTRASRWLYLEDGKVAFAANKDQWRAGLKYLRSLSDDGVLTPTSSR